MSLRVCLFFPLTRVPEKLDCYTDSPPLSSGNSPHKVVSHPGVSTLSQPQLCDDVVHLWQETANPPVTYNICLPQHTEEDTAIISGPRKDYMQNVWFIMSSCCVHSVLVVLVLIWFVCRFRLLILPSAPSEPVWSGWGASVWPQRRESHGQWGEEEGGRLGGHERCSSSPAGACWASRWSEPDQTPSYRPHRDMLLCPAKMFYHNLW